jgi:hypothetical protein
MYLAAVAPLLVAAALAPIANAEAGGTRWGSDYFPNVPLTTQDGKVVHFYDDLLKGKVVAIDLVYTHYRCAACHSIGRGERVGPDLAGVTRMRDQAWLKRYLAAPDRMLAAGDPIARSLDARYGSAKMPNLRLGEADVTALVDYLAEQQGPAVTSDGTAPARSAATAGAGRQ